jgi:phosphoglycolate phosphatase
MSMPEAHPAAKGIRIVLFDLDGTFADTAQDLAFALNQTLEMHGRKPLPFEQIRPVVSHGGIALIRLGFGMEPEEKGFDPIRQDLLRIYRENIARETRLFDGMDQVLEQLEHRGMRWGIVTNKPSWLTDPLMEALGLSERAACIISGDTLNNRKPHPEPILYACELAGGTAAECLYVGDAERDIEAGRNAGTATLTALFGYIGDEDQPENWGADATISDPAEILDWLGMGLEA